MHSAEPGGRRGARAARAPVVSAPHEVAVERPVAQLARRHAVQAAAPGLAARRGRRGRVGDTARRALEARKGRLRPAADGLPRKDQPPHRLRGQLQACCVLCLQRQAPGCKGPGCCPGAAVLCAPRTRLHEPADMMPLPCSRHEVRWTDAGRASCARATCLAAPGSASNAAEGYVLSCHAPPHSRRRWRSRHACRRPAARPRSASPARRGCRGPPACTPCARGRPPPARPAAAGPGPGGSAQEFLYILRVAHVIPTHAKLEYVSAASTGKASIEQPGRACKRHADVHFESLSRAAHACAWVAPAVRAHAEHGTLRYHPGPQRAMPRAGGAAPQQARGGSAV